MVALSGLIARAMEALGAATTAERLRSSVGHPLQRKIKRSFYRIRSGKYQPRVIDTDERGAPRPSSFALGNGRGSNGLEPGVKGPRVPFVPNARWQRAKAKRDAKQAR